MEATSMNAPSKSVLGWTSLGELKAKLSMKKCLRIVWDSFWSWKLHTCVQYTRIAWDSSTVVSLGSKQNGNGRGWGWGHWKVPYFFLHLHLLCTLHNWQCWQSHTCDVQMQWICCWTGKPQTSRKCLPFWQFESGREIVVLMGWNRTLEQKGTLGT